MVTSPSRMVTGAGKGVGGGWVAVGTAVAGSEVGASVAADDWGGGVQVGGSVGTGSRCDRELLSSRTSRISSAASTKTMFSPLTYPSNHTVVVWPAASPSGTICRMPFASTAKELASALPRFSIQTVMPRAVEA